MRRKSDQTDHGLEFRLNFAQKVGGSRVFGGVAGWHAHASAVDATRPWAGVSLFSLMLKWRDIVPARVGKTTTGKDFSGGDSMTPRCLGTDCLAREAVKPHAGGVVSFASVADEWFRGFDGGMDAASDAMRGCH